MNPAGRPRDPKLAQRVLDTVTAVLVDRGLHGFTVDEVATAARVGKASIYRRWNTVEEILVDVVTDLGVLSVDYRMTPGTLRGDLVDLLCAAATGPRAAAEAAVLPAIGRIPALHDAYVSGPLLRLVTAIERLAVRARRRGEGELPSIEPIRAAAAYLLWQRLLTGEDPRPADIAHLVDVLVVPALCTRRAVPA